MALRTGWHHRHARANRLLFGTGQTELFALSEGGVEQWTAEKPAEHFRFGAATNAVVAGIAERTVHVYDQQSGERTYTYDVEAEHVGRVAATPDRVIVGDANGLYALDG